jgi:tellurite resistance protein TehA-like permease
VNTLRPLQPIAALIAVATLMLVIVALARAISARAGFLVERPAVLLVWLIGLLIAGAIFAGVARRTWRGEDSPSSLWPMTATILALASPLTLMLLQHPAP